jgi:hypothetical protein
MAGTPPDHDVVLAIDSGADRTVALLVGNTIHMIDNSSSSQEEIGNNSFPGRGHATAERLNATRLV